MSKYVNFQAKIEKSSNVHLEISVKGFLSGESLSKTSFPKIIDAICSEVGCKETEITDLKLSNQIIDSSDDEWL